MAMQESGKGAATGSGASPSLTSDKADEIAAAFRPAWDVDEPDDVASPQQPEATAPTAPAVIASPVILAGSATSSREAQPSSEAIEPEQVLEIAPAPKPVSSPPPAPVPKKGATPLSTGRAISMKPVAKPDAPVVATARDPFRESTGDIVLPKKSKGTVYVITGLAVAAGVGLLLKFFAADEAPKQTAPATQTASPAPTKEDIPPPAPKEPASTTTVAKAEPAKAEPAKAEPAKAEPAKAEPPPPKAPAPAREPAVAPKEPPPKPATAAPKPVRPAPAPPAPKPEKTAPKPAGGAIVRDNPF